MPASHLQCAAFLVHFLASLALLAAEKPTGAAAKDSLPDEALADDVIMVMHADLARVDLRGLCTTIARDLGSKTDLALPRARTYQAASEKLRRAGLTRVVYSEGVQRSEFFARSAAGKANADAESALRFCAVVGGPAAHGAQLQPTGDWLAMRSAQSQTRPESTGQHKKDLAAALRALGTSPGLALALPDDLRQMADRALAGARSQLPAEVVRFLEASQKIRWIAVTARIDAKPTLALRADLPDKDSATDLAQSFGPALEAMKKMFPPDPDFDSPLMAHMLPLLDNLRPAARGNRFEVIAETPKTLEILDWFTVGQKRQLVRTMGANVLRLESLYAWALEAYPLQHGKWPAKLADLKPLLADDPAEQEKRFRQLLTDPETDEFPSVAYTPPERSFSEALKPHVGPRPPKYTPVLVEISKGKPKPGGFHVNSDGVDFTIGTGPAR